MREEQLRKLHEYEVLIMDEFDRICKKHGLRYYLAEGTLLGAVRHQGFIPWDDDVDLAMPRADYNKLLEIAKTELDPRFCLQSIHNDPGYDHFFAKIRMNNTLFVEKGLENIDRHHGIYVDIWPLDFCREDFGIVRKVRKEILLLTKYKIRLRLNKNAPISTKKLRRKIAFTLLEPFPKKFLVRVVECLMKGKGDCYVNWGSAYGWRKHTIKISHYDPPVMLTFEGKQYPAPKDYDYWLRRIYGDDYMQMPPVEKRVTHNPVRLSFDTNGPDEVLD